MRISRLAAWTFAAFALTAFDWPGRASTIATVLREAPPERRCELLREAAGAHEPEARALIVAALGDESPMVRAEAATLASRARITEAIPVLTRWLDDADTSMRLAATRALGVLRIRGSISSLLRVLGDADREVRVEAVRAVGAIGGDAAVVALLDRVSDAESTVRVAAVRALGALGDRRAVFSLLGALQDPIPEVRVAAAVALGALDDPRSLRGLLGATHDPSIDVRVAAVRAVGSSPAAIADLAAVALRTSREWEPAAQSRLAVVAVQALARMGTPEAIEVLVTVVRRGAESIDRAPARAALESLAASGDAARAHIHTLIAAAPPEFFGLTLSTVGTLGGDEAARAILGVLERPGLTPAQRASALVALGATGSALATLPLLMATDEDPSRREALRVGSSGLLMTAELPDPVRACAQPRVAPGVLAGLQALEQRRGTLGPASLDVLAALHTRVERGCESERATVIALMGATGNRRAPRVLAALLAAPRERIRVAAARALMRAGVEGVEREVVEALADVSPTVRLVAADTLAQHAGPAALAPLLARWQSEAPVDRAGLARAMGRAAGRALRAREATTSVTQAAQALAHCAERSGISLAAACVDALADLAALGEPSALRALEAELASFSPRRVLVALDAHANAAAMATEPWRSRLLAAMQRRTSNRASPRERAIVAWALGDGGVSLRDELIAMLSDGSSAVAANAAASLGRVSWTSEADRAMVTEALCVALGASRHDALTVNALVSLARVSPDGGCALPSAASLLSTHRSPWVRVAAARWLRRVVGTGLERATVALSRCALADPAPTVAAVCRARAASGGDDAHATSTVDVQLVGDDEVPTVLRDHALLLPDGYIRMGTTGPDGWVHLRPTARGVFSALDLAALTSAPSVSYQ